MGDPNFIIEESLILQALDSQKRSDLQILS